MDYETFVAAVRLRLNREVAPAFDPQEELRGLLIFDSLDAYELLVAIESLPGACASEAMPAIRTMKDAFAYYLSIAVG